MAYEAPRPCRDCRSSRSIYAGLCRDCLPRVPWCVVHRAPVFSTAGCLQCARPVPVTGRRVGASLDWRTIEAASTEDYARRYAFADEPGYGVNG